MADSKDNPTLLKRVAPEDGDVINDAKKIKVEEEKVIQEAAVSQQKLKRKKCAMLVAYSGQGFYGMQRNHGFKTIEDELLNAMHKANLITEENCQTPQSMWFQRASRTDKGVSAVRQIVSLRIAEDENMVQKINDNLPPQIRLFCVRRTTKNFDAKISCDARTYSYLCPSYAFAPIEELTSEEFRITSEILDKINDVLKYFKGSHNFFNYTSGKKPNETSAIRYIISFQCSEPFVKDGVEFVVFTVKGQSFMLHQIRKMIGVTIAIVKGVTAVDVIQKAWEATRVDIPKAPGLGLMLEEVHYERYNKRFGGDGMHEPLEWSQFQNQLKEFKEKYIYPVIIEGEKKEKSMMSWLSTLMWHTFGDRVQGPPGIPQNLSPFGLASLNTQDLKEKEQPFEKRQNNECEKIVLAEASKEAGEKQEIVDISDQSQLKTEVNKESGKKEEETVRISDQLEVTTKPHDSENKLSTTECKTSELIVPS